MTLNADYSTLTYRKMLVFVSSSHLQRFPLHVTTDAKVLEFASQIGKHGSNWRQLFLWSVACILVSVFLLTYKQMLMIQYTNNDQPQS